MSLTRDELVQAVQLGGKYITEEVSWREILEMSYDAGGVYPTLVGYALGSIAVLFITRCTSWVRRLVPAVLCVMLLLHSLHNLERKSFEWLLVMAAVTGVCCTYMQLISLDLVLEYFTVKKKLVASNMHKKDD